MGSIYQDGPTLMQESISPRQQWKIDGTLNNPLYAIDGNINTAATIGSPYRNAQLTIDLGKACLFNMVVIEHGAKEFDFTRRITISSSTDGKNFIPQVEVPDLRRVATVLLRHQQLARYIRIQATEEGAATWSIAEIYVQ